MSRPSRRRLAPLRSTLAACCMLAAAASAWAGPEQDFAEADRLFASGELIVGMQLMLKAAEDGHPEAQARVGALLDKSEEDDQAFEWFSKSAAQGNASGQLGLGEMYAKGEGAKADMERAYQLVLAAANQGHPQATKVLMLAYAEGGLGRAADPAQHQLWLEKLKQVMPDYRPGAPAVNRAKVVRRRGERK